MTGSIEEITQNIVEIAQGHAPADAAFLIKRSKQAGTPLLWEEIISIERGGKSRYSTLRSFVNAGGSSIGSWEGPADEKAIKAIASALLQANFLDIANSPIAPGGEEDRWEIAVQDGDAILASAGDPDVLMQLSELDVQLRRIANTLVASGSGSALNIQLVIEQKGAVAEIQVALTNEGNMDFQIQNPFLSSADTLNFLRVEIGAIPVEVPGVTGTEIMYRPLMLPISGTPVAPWDQECVIIKAGQNVLCPFQLKLDLSVHRGHVIQATYSHYGNTQTHADLPLVRGRVFSTETQLT